MITHFFVENDKETNREMLECILNGMKNQIEQSRKEIDKVVDKILEKTSLFHGEKLKIWEEQLKDEFEYYAKQERLDVPYWFKSMCVERIEFFKKQIETEKKFLQFIKNVKAGKTTNGITDRQIELARQYPLKDVVEVNRYGFVLCPFHEEKTPSFKVFKDNKFKCFGCGEYGDVIHFVMKKDGLEFQEAVKFLCTK